MDTQPLDIAVVGCGVAGLAAAHVLQRRHRVTVFEKNDHLGGHTHTVVIPDGPDAGTPVDTGFIVFNTRTYPNFIRLLDDLGVAARASEMSFSFTCRATGLVYAGTDLNGLFAQRRNLLRPAFLGMLRDIGRFGRRAGDDLAAGRLAGRTLGDYLADLGLGRAFRDDYLLPMGAAIWSTPTRDMLAFPAESFIRFFGNHGLLTLRDRPQWQTVAGGSHSYVKAFAAAFRGELRPGTAVAGVRRDADGVTVHLADGASRRFHHAVIATHADEALALLEDPTPDETRLLGAWRYNRNHTVLHTDAAALPPLRRAWAAWNYARAAGADGESRLSVTYHMNRLQGLAAAREYCVSLNRPQPPAPGCTVAEMLYTHPMYTTEALASQAELPALSGPHHTHFCGSYHRWGFHEDAVASGLAVCRRFGLEL
ncbi:MAG TPA: FAD-dependent oxidoreductase [Acidobacteriota bacterium]|jgi:predicted NAD/FAD-binding protein|nr:FAD-dependent oxidoreductase [Acidobacteriota bacterium]HNT99082.1 FAD-dependent oxidoreductase [Acidobacteriota bacterium]